MVIPERLNLKYQFIKEENLWGEKTTLIKFHPRFTQLSLL